MVFTTGTLAVGSYVVTGTDHDTDGGTGTWTFTLTVTASTLDQTTVSETGSTTTGDSSSYTSDLAVNSSNGTVSYVATGGAQESSFTVTGDVISTVGALPAGTFVVTGSDHDTDGDTGTWTFTLTVTASASGGAPSTTLTQTSPTAGVTTTKASSTFVPQPLAVSGAVGAVTFTVTSSSTGLALSGDQISTTGTLATGKYTISGTDSDTSGDTGTWTYTLTVTNNIVQTSATTGATTSAASSSFKPGAIAVTNNTGAVTFATTVSSAALHVSSGGVITTTGTLKAGAYTVSGTDSDASGDSGTWTYTLSVANPVYTVIFDANGGTGSMGSEHANKATALTLNAFTRPGFGFAGWNTAPDGTGLKYANGATYPFTAPATLFAQWKMGKPVVHTVFFVANGGLGAMAPERASTATALSLDGFTRRGYTFADWTTAAGGAGTDYPNGATYGFTASATLYAQWRVRPHRASTYTVTFNAHGGTGSMTPERAARPTSLAPVSFTRSGYTFSRWSTNPNGSGDVFANAGTFPFNYSATLYAQWRANKSGFVPGVTATVIVSSFAIGSFALTPALEAQTDSLAVEFFTDHDTKITLVGYGDKLTPAGERNETVRAKNYTLSQNRAYAVETYLHARLVALDVKTVAITATGYGAAPPSPPSTSPTKSALVIATIS